MNAAASLLALLALAAAAPPGGDRLKQLDRGCEVVREAYPMLMLAAMAEGPMDCGTHTGESVDCYAGETPDEAARRAKRLEVRTRQEAAFKHANDACALYTANRRLESAQEAAAAGLELARRIGTNHPEEIKEKPSGAEPR